jgi:hypothetical protein
MTAIYISLAVGILLLAFGALWHAVVKQGERLKAMGLGIQFLIEKSEQKPNTYVMDRLRDALRE